MAGMATNQIKAEGLVGEGSFHQMRISAQAYLDARLASSQSAIDNLGWGAAYLGALG